MSKIIKQSGNWKLSEKYLETLDESYWIEAERLLTEEDIKEWIEHLKDRIWPEYNGFEDLVYLAKEIFNQNKR